MNVEYFTSFLSDLSKTALIEVSNLFVEDFVTDGNYNIVKISIVFEITCIRWLKGCEGKLIRSYLSCSTIKPTK